MQKNIVLFITVIAFCLFTLVAIAQAPSSSSSSTQTPSASSGQSTASDQAAANSGEQTLDGCIVKEQADYFIQPESGDRERLTGSQDLSPHVGHHVKVHGLEAANSASTGSSSNASDRTSTSGTASKETQNNAAGSMAGNAGSSNATGTGSHASNVSGKNFNVTRVDMVSESCPASIQSKIDQNKPH